MAARKGFADVRIGILEWITEEIRNFTDAYLDLPGWLCCCDFQSTMKDHAELVLLYENNTMQINDSLANLCYLTLTLPMVLLWRHLQSGVVSENGLIASKNAIDDAFHLVRDEYHKDRTGVKVVELY